MGVISSCCPDVNFIQVVSGHLSKFAYSDFDFKKELRHTGKSAYTFFKKSMDIPAQISDILKMSIKGQTKLNMELSGADETLRDVKRMMDKLVISNISAALIIASSLICTTDMKPKIAGIPLIGFMGFIGAAILGIWLVYGILTKRKN